MTVFRLTIPSFKLSTLILFRPQSAVGSKEADHKIKIAFHYMSPEIAGLIRDALGPDFYDVARYQEDTVKVEETQITDSEAVDRLNTCK
jgi:hypothetical protein